MKGGPEYDLAEELSTFNSLSPEWKKENDGRYVAIVGSRVLGVFESPGDAWNAGAGIALEGCVFVRLLSRPRVIMVPMLGRVSGNS